MFNKITYLLTPRSCELCWSAGSPLRFRFYVDGKQRSISDADEYVSVRGEVVVFRVQPVANQSVGADDARPDSPSPGSGGIGRHCHAVDAGSPRQDGRCVTRLLLWFN